MPKSAQQKAATENLTVREVCVLKNVGLTTVYAALNAGSLVAIKVGKKTLIPTASVEAWWANFPRWMPSKPVAPRISPNKGKSAASCITDASAVDPPTRR